MARGNIIFSKKYFVSLAEKRKVPLRLFEKLSFLHIHLALNSPSHISTHRHSCPSSTSTYAGFLWHEPSLVALATKKCHPQFILSGILQRWEHQPSTSRKRLSALMHVRITVNRENCTHQKYFWNVIVMWEKSQSRMRKVNCKQER